MRAAMARLDTPAIVWLCLLGGGILGIAGVGGYAAWQRIHEPRPRPEQPVVDIVTPPPTPAGAQRHPAAPVPRFIAHDAERPADEAYRDLWAAISRGDADVAAKYVPAAKLRDMRTGDEVIDSFLGLSPIENVHVVETRAEAEKAVLFVKASSPSITDARGRRAPIAVVVRMERESGHWTVQSQMWLVSTAPEDEQARALRWLKGEETEADRNR